MVKKLHFEEEKMSGQEEEVGASPKPQSINEEQMKEPTELESLENRILDKIGKMLAPIQLSLNNLTTEWKEHKEEMRQMKTAQLKLEHELSKEKKKTRDLGRRVRWLEDKLLENNVVLCGIAETAWETEDVCKEKIINALANLVNRATWPEKLEVARLIPITLVRRVGIYNSMRRRPVVVSFSCRSDVEYLLENKKRLGRGIFADREYGPETEKNRKLLRPIFNAARKHENYKEKCKWEGDKLIINGKEYTVETIGTLPPKINGFSATIKSDGLTLAFFGELNSLSKFHPCEFEHNGIIFHSSEQLIQYMKSIYFDDKVCATAILNSDSPLQCKMLAKNIINFDNEEWMKVARGLCDVGIYEKFHQNPSLKNLLLSTGE